MTQAHKKQTYDRGIKAEIIAALWLQCRGYKILERRYKTKVGEVDIIAKKGKTISFIEVKARATKDQALESLTYNMRQRIERAALYYLATQKEHNCDIRFDLIVVTPPFFVHHLDNAWQQAA